MLLLFAISRTIHTISYNIHTQNLHTRFRQWGQEIDWAQDQINLDSQVIRKLKRNFEICCWSLAEGVDKKSHRRTHARTRPSSRSVKKNEEKLELTVIFYIEQCDSYQIRSNEPYQIKQDVDEEKETTKENAKLKVNSKRQVVLFLRGVVTPLYCARYFSVAPVTDRPGLSGK